MSHRWRSTSEQWDLLKPLTRQLRARLTKAEQILWERLRDRRLGPRFRRQAPIDRYIVDFYCAEAKLIIEVDGPIHERTVEEDQQRQAVIEAQDLHVLRFTNEQVENDLPAVLKKIQSQLDLSRQAKMNPPPRTTQNSPLQEWRGGGGEV